MRRIALLSALAVATLSTPALAGVTFQQDYYGLPAPAGSEVICDADGVPCAGLSGSYQIFSSTIPGIAAAFPGNTTNQIAVLGGNAAMLTVDRFVEGFTFDWGSMDQYNTIRFDTSEGLFQIPGTLFSFANGDQFSTNSNFRANFTFDSPAHLNWVEFSSGSNSFEWDNFAIRPASVMGGVPEPATWAMMIVGFGAIGASMRSRQKKSLANTALTAA